jgi:hypothetical protein
LTIEIDDAGTGDLIGDAVIAFWRRELNELVIKHIPLELYQSPEFSDLTKKYVKDLFTQAIAEMKIPQTEEILLCSGNIFDEAREMLKNSGYLVREAKIEGYLQDAVEGAYLQYLNDELGVPPSKGLNTSGKDRYFVLFNWVSQDFPRRERFVKSGFEKWNSKWRDMARDDWMRSVVQYPESTGNNQAEIDELEPNESGTESEPMIESEKKLSRGKGKNSAPKGRKMHKKSTHKPGLHPKASRSHDRDHSHGHPRGHGGDRKYSSTDPNPRRKLF